MTTQYPVIEEHALPPLARRLLGARRDPQTMPTPKPGTVLVFQVGDRWEAYLEGRHVRGNEAAVVNAVSVSLVDIRNRDVGVDLRIPSSNVSHDFLVRSTFNCRVVRPEVVAAAAMVDVTRELSAHLSQDRDLAALGLQYDIDSVNEVRGLAVARVRAYCTVRPPEVDGMSVELASVELLTPNDLRGHHLRLRTEVWDQAFDALKRSGRDVDVAWLEQLLNRGPTAKEAYALSTGAMNPADTAERGYELEQRRRDDLLKLLTVLADSDQLNRVTIDAAHLFDSLSESLTGSRPPERDPMLGKGATNGASSLPAGDDDAPPYEDLDDDFVD
jgi:hypothetical protein